MTDTIPDMNELRTEVIQSLKYFSKICRIRVEDNEFIQQKIDQISDQRVEFRNFAEKSIPQSLRMCGYAEDLIAFAECCEDDGISEEDLLESLTQLLSDIKLYKSEATSLKKQLERVKNSLGGISEEIFNYNAEITRKREYLSNRIDETNKETKGAWSRAKGGYIVTGVGAVIAAVSIPLTGGASLVALGCGSLVALGG
jgi:hypothetical protein